MRLGSKRVVRRHVGLEVSIDMLMECRARMMTHLQVERTGKASTASVTLVSLLWVIGCLARNVASTATIEVGER